ncbi:ABC transporter ATP-binding protein [Halocalculus aciditolerans]|uniref:Copper ABC transporter ATP-binding protein n=1 Tax=Halocalculus aciditolerans TaxID=1383812 RepID=A0A830FF22_9EURY|nr:ABC transporter ATP-binding protein [Halocalculus aciditolerans]GGL46953.1 copper ABC transporter ATP-binding protein [Halocalculus aciditolerans]
MTAIELDGVRKEYGDVVALQGLDLEVDEGEVFGFLGPNGAGKSTTINVLLDFVRPTDGSATVFGLDAQAESVAVRERTGVLPEGFSTYDRLTGRQHVSFAVESKGADDDPDALLERVGLGDAGDRKAGGYSKGMRQRLALAMALSGDPDLLVLDEPSSGLDPAGAKEMRDIVRAEADSGTTVFFSSHVLGQVEAICDRVGILQEGEVVAVDTIENLRESVAADAALHVTGDIPDAALDAARAAPGVTAATRTDHGVTVSCDDDTKIDALVALRDAGATVASFRTEEASLEDLFLTLTENADDADDADSADGAAAADAPDATAGGESA